MLFVSAGCICPELTVRSKHFFTRSNTGVDVITHTRACIGISCANLVSGVDPSVTLSRTEQYCMTICRNVLLFVDVWCVTNV